MPASGGSISLRLALVGSEQVKAALASLGPAGASAMKQIEAAQSGPTAGFRALNAAGKDVMGTMAGMAGRAGTLGSALSAIGPAGLAAAAAIGAVVEAVGTLAKMAKDGAEWAEQLSVAATKLGETTTAVQQYDYAALASGVSTEAMRGGLESLNVALGKVQDNLSRGVNSRQQKAFNALGITKEDLATFKSASDLMPVIADRIQNVRTAAEQTAIAKALGLEELLPLLKQGGAALKSYLDEANRGNVVAPDLVHNMTQMNEQMKLADARADAAAHTMEAKMVPALVDVKNAAADAMQWVAKLFATPIGQSKSESWAQSMRAGFMAQARAQAIRSGSFDLTTPGGNILTTAGERENAAMSAEHDAAVAFASAASTQSSMRVDALHNGILGLLDAGAAPPSGSQSDQPAGGGRGRGARDTGSEKGSFGPTDDKGPAALAAADEDLLAATKAQLQAELSIAKDADRQASLKKQIAAIDEQSAQAGAQKRLDEINQQRARGEISPQVAYQLLMELEASEAIRKRVQTLKDQAADAEKAHQAALNASRMTEIGLQNQVDLLQAQLPLTHAMQDRRDIALKIFDLEEQIRELKLSEIAADKNSPAASRADAAAQLAGLQATAGARRQGVSNANPSGPWSAEMQKLQDGAVGVNQEFQDIAAQGLDKFNQGLIDANGRIANMGDLLRSVFASALQALEQYLLKQAELSALNAIFGNGQKASSGPASGGGNFLSQIFSSIFGGGTSGASSAGSNLGSSIGDSISFAAASGGYIVGPGGPKSDSIIAAVSNREFIMNAASTARYLPLLHAMNSGRPLPIPRFADGGVVGAGNDMLGYLSPTHVHFHQDNSIHAPGADPAQLQRVVEAHQQYAKGEPARFVSYVKALNRGRSR